MNTQHLFLTLGLLTLGVETIAQKKVTVQNTPLPVNVKNEVLAIRTPDGGPLPVRLSEPVQVTQSKVEVTNWPVQDVPPPEMFNKDEVYLWHASLSSPVANAQVKVLEQKGRWVLGEFISCGGGQRYTCWFDISAQEGCWEKGTCR